MFDNFRKLGPKNSGETLAATADEKTIFFDNVKPIKDTLHMHFGDNIRCIEQICLIDQSIVEVIIGDMLWDPNKERQKAITTRRKMMESFGDKILQRLKVGVVSRGILFLSRISCSGSSRLTTLLRVAPLYKLQK